jgi:hypothetical protein
VCDLEEGPSTHDCIHVLPHHHVSSAHLTRVCVCVCVAPARVGARACVCKVQRAKSREQRAGRTFRNFLSAGFLLMLDSSLIKALIEEASISGFSFASLHDQ